jgi:hypothetical protein
MWVDWQRDGKQEEWFKNKKNKKQPALQTEN